MSSRLSKKKKTTAEEALQRVKEHSDSLARQIRKKKRRKPIRFEICTDPKTGLRDYKGTYDASKLRSTHQDADIGAEHPTGMSESDFNCEENPVSTESLGDMIQYCETLLDSMGTTKKKTPSWAKRMTDMQEDWSKSRSTIFNWVVSDENLHSDKCSFCCGSNASVRCHQCGLCSYLCVECDERLHSLNPFHDREMWNGGFYEPISPMEKCDGNKKTESERFLHLGTGNCPSCCTVKSLTYLAKKETIAVITINGRFDFNKCTVKCTNCNLVCEPLSDTKLIVRNGYWPGSLKSTSAYIFHQDIFRMWNIFQKGMPGTSQRSFLDGLGEFSSQKGRNGIINPTVFSVAFKEWKYCQFEMESLQGVNWMECPCCEKEQHSCHVDGNMKLYRYKHSGISRSECYYGNIFIADREDVKTHLQQFYKESSDLQESKCGESTWKAARNKNVKRAKLDETGLDIAGCRHSVAQFAVNMFQGELYGYAHYILAKTFLEKPLEFFWQDIMCKFWKWANKSDPGFNQYQIKPALSVMHAKAHNWTCQVLWGGRWQEGAACATAEEVEQINSYFSRLGNTTKYMLPESRDEILTECARSWNKRKINNMVQYLCKRYYRAVEMSTSSLQQLDELMEDLKLNTEDVCFTEWKSEVQQVARAEELHTSTKTGLTVKEEYFLTCEHLRQVEVMEDLANSSATVIGTVVTYQILYSGYMKALKDVPSIQIRVAELEKHFGEEFDRVNVLEEGKQLLTKRSLNILRTKIEMIYFSVLKTTSAISKLADTSKQRTKLRRKVLSEKEEMKKLIGQYTELYDGDQVIDCVAILEGKFPWTTEESINTCSPGVPVRVKATIVEHYMMTERWKEEIGLMKVEMERFLTFYSKEVLPRLIEDIRKINEELEVVISDTDPGRSMSSSQDEEMNINTEEEVTQYKVVNTSNSYLRGLQSVKRKGVDYCVDQLSLGIEHFARITLGDYSQINECFLSFPWCEDNDGADENTDTFFHDTDDSDDDATASDNDKDLELNADFLHV